VYVRHIICFMEATCFDPLQGHHQAFFGIKSVIAAYMFGIPTMLTNSRNITYITIELPKIDAIVSSVFRK